MVEAHGPLDLGLPLRGGGSAPGLLCGALGGGRGGARQAGGEVGVGSAEGGRVCVDSGLLLLCGGHFQSWMRVSLLLKLLLSRRVSWWCGGWLRVAVVGETLVGGLLVCIEVHTW